MSTLSQFGFGGGGGIKKILRGVIRLPTPAFNGAKTQVAIISPVDTSKSILYYLGVINGVSSQAYANGAYGTSTLAMIQLTTSTTITATIGDNNENFGASATSTPPTISWQLVEYY